MGYVKGRVDVVLSHIFFIIGAVHPLIHSKACRCGKPTASKASKCKCLGEAKMNLPSDHHLQMFIRCAGCLHSLLCYPIFEKKKNKKTHPGVVWTLNFETSFERPRLSSRCILAISSTVSAQSWSPKLAGFTMVVETAAKPPGKAVKPGTVRCDFSDDSQHTPLRKMGGFSC